MSPFKKFTDFLGGVCAFVASFFLLRKFMEFSPADDPSLSEKLKLFFAPDATQDYRAYVSLVALLVLAVALGRILPKLPLLSFSASVLAFVQVIMMYDDDKLYERPMLYFVLIALHLLGGMYDALYADAADHGHRAFLFANVTCAMSAAFGGLIIWRMHVAMQALNVPAEEAVPLSELHRFDQICRTATEAFDSYLWITLSGLCLFAIVISVLLRGVYWLDLLCSLLPLVLALVWQTSGELLPHSIPLVALLCITFLCRLIMTVSAKPWQKKRKPTQEE